MSSLSSRQMLTLVAVSFAVIVAGALYLNLSSARAPSSLDVSRSASATFECTLKSVQDTRVDFDQCADDVQREYRLGSYAPWYERQPVLASLLAGGVTFFAIAGGGRLFMK